MRRRLPWRAADSLLRSEFGSASGICFRRNWFLKAEDLSSMRKKS